MQYSLLNARSIFSELRRYGAQPDVYKVKKLKLLFIEINLYTRITQVGPRLDLTKYVFSPKDTKNYCSYDDLKTLAFWNKVKILKTENSVLLYDTTSKVKRLYG